MTTITIKQDHNLPQTEFANVDELAGFLFAYCADQQLPELTADEITEAEQAKQQWADNPSAFRRVTRDK